MSLPLMELGQKETVQFLPTMIGIFGELKDAEAYFFDAAVEIIVDVLDFRNGFDFRHIHLQIEEPVCVWKQSGIKFCFHQF